MEQYPGDLLVRYEAGKPEIGRLFFDGRDPGAILSARSVGDRHLHGASVLRLETEAGPLYYKPRDCACTDFLAALCQALFGERMTPAQLSGEGYAFQEALSREIPAPGAPRGAYYRRLGRLTAVFYALGSTDMHRDNVLAAGERAVAVDTETLLCARAPGVGGAGEFSAEYGDVFPEYGACVGECMVLPRFYALRRNSPLLPGKGCEPGGYEDEFLRGFEEGYRLLSARRETVCALLDAYADMPLRYVLRSTRAYGAILAAMLRAKDDAEREAALAGLEKGLSASERERWLPILDWEKTCVRGGDVPYFWLRAGETALRGDVVGDALLPGFVACSPSENAKRRLRRMDERDLAVQSAYIRGSLRHIDGWENRIAKYLPPVAKAPETLPAPLSPEAAAGEAAQALQLLWDERIALSGGRVLWHMPMSAGRIGCLFGLGDGFSGVAVFCQAMAASPLLAPRQTAMARELAAGCFRDMAAFAQRLLELWPEPPEEGALRRRFDGGFDFADGLAGFLWALERCGGEDPRLAGLLLDGLRGWGVPAAFDAELSALERAPEEPWSGADTLLGGGAARRAAAYLLRHARGDAAAADQAGSLLAWMERRKRERGVYTVFPQGRKQYFLPAFLRGSLGAAYVMLRYAEACGNAEDHRLAPGEV